MLKSDHAIAGLDSGFAPGFDRGQDLRNPIGFGTRIIAEVFPLNFKYPGWPDEARAEWRGRVAA